MKYFILIISLFSFTTKAFSQDSITIKTEIDTFKQSNYEGQFDYAFSRKEPRKQLFKFGGMANYNNSYLELVYERKLSTDVSINIALSNTGQGDFIDNYGGNFTSFLKLGVEPRWYYTMKKDIKKGLISDNLNGNYVGLRTNINYTHNSGRQGGGFNLSSELTFGLQRRILRNQYLDINLGAGVLHRFNKLNVLGETTNQNRGLFNYRFTYGIILDNNLFKRNKAPNCEVLRCFEEEKSLWKVGVNKILTIYQDGISSNLNIANEHKIGNSAWSIENKLSLYAKKINSERLRVGTQLYGANLQVTPRFYWDLNKRIAKGESANNLSGKYVGLSLNYGSAKYKSLAIPADPKSNANYTITLNSASIIPHIGFQKRLLNHLFIDANAGYGAVKGFHNNIYSRNWTGGISANFTFGLSF